MQGRGKAGGRGGRRPGPEHGSRGSKAPAVDKSRVQTLTKDLAGPVVAELGVELVDVEFVKEGGRWVLRVLIDKPGGVTIDDCEAVSGPLGRAIDDVDPIPVEYSFEVSSPGAERPLVSDADFVRFAGRKVRVALFAPLEGRKVVEGALVGLRDGLVVIEEDGRETALPRSVVAQVRLALETIGGYGR